jgi:uncharacterized membrane protein YbhN (UPF0104 family)
MIRWRLLRVGVSVAVVAAMAWVIHRYWDDVRNLPRIAPWLAVVVAGLYLVVRWLNGIAMRAALRAMGYSITLYEALMLAVLTTYGNLFVPRAGLGVPAVYLRVRRGVDVGDFTIQAIVVTILQTAGIGVTGLLALAALWAFHEQAPDPLVAGLFVLALVLGLAAVFVRSRPEGPRGTGRIARTVHQVAIAWSRVSSSRRTVAVIFLLDVPMLLLRAVRLQLVFQALGQEVNFFAVFVASALGDLMFLVSVTPAGLGFREAAITYSATLLGVPPAVALTASLVDRVIWTVAVIVVAQVGMWTLVTPAIRQLSRPGAPPGG